MVRTKKSMEVEVQYACDGGNLELPDREDLATWARAALGSAIGPTDIVIRIVDVVEGRALNKSFRNEDHPTNVLSFPFDAPAELNDKHLGDLVICAPVVQREADEQQKPARAHWAHMVVHGVLHLRGYDHREPAAADTMEGVEVEILRRLGFDDPYAESSCRDS